LIKKIISGGQTGADRGGLEAVKENGITTGGYCPKGWLTENGPDVTLKEFGLIEMDTADYKKRTIKNIETSDGTVIFGAVGKRGGILSGGSKLTLSTAKKLKKPVIVNPDEITFKSWLAENNIQILNVAGNRESVNPGLEKKVKNYLLRTFNHSNL
jgi:hypothetical protein